MKKLWNAHFKDTVGYAPIKWRENILVFILGMLSVYLSSAILLITIGNTEISSTKKILSGLNHMNKNLFIIAIIISVFIVPIWGKFFINKRISFLKLFIFSILAVLPIPFFLIMPFIPAFVTELTYNTEGLLSNILKTIFIPFGIGYFLWLPTPIFLPLYQFILVYSRKKDYERVKLKDTKLRSSKET